MFDSFLSLFFSFHFLLFHVVVLPLGFCRFYTSSSTNLYFPFDTKLHIRWTKNLANTRSSKANKFILFQTPYPRDHFDRSHCGVRKSR